MPTEAELATSHADVLVVGGGVVGVCAAWFLAERGVRTVLIERDEIASGCSFGNAGWIFPSHSSPIPGPGILREALRWARGLRSPRASAAAEVSPFSIRPRLDPALLRWIVHFLRACNDAQMRRSFRVRRELGLRSQALFETLAARPDLEFGYTQHGLLVVCESSDSLAEATEELRLLEELGGQGRVLAGEELRKRLPAVSHETAGGILYPDDAHIDPERFVAGLAREAMGRGVRIETGTEVIRIETDGDRVTRAITTRGDLRCDHLVLAAGSWSAGLVHSLGIRLPIEPAKGYSITARRDPEAGDTPLLLADVHVAVTPMGERLRLAGALELRGLDLSIDSQRVRSIIEGVRRQLPGLAALEDLETWSGLRPLAPDDLPLIGHPTGFANLVIAAGHGMSGICQGPASGELAAQLVLGETPDLDPAPFSPRRF